MLWSRGFALESATARVCREAGGSVTTNSRTHNMDIANVALRFSLTVCFCSMERRWPSPATGENAIGCFGGRSGRKVVTGYSALSAPTGQS